jgi:prolyl-tRNA editing enzyme YbaK/EbsC (Cys-tRNA(Pro) deacylase)
MKAAVARVVAALREHDIDPQITVFAESTRTAEDAAAAIGTTVGQIVKSLVFLADERPILALVSGSNRADMGKLERLAGGVIARADAATVRAATGYAIGGVPPVGHATALTTYLDRDLLTYPLVWAAAGTPNAVFAITPGELTRITHGEIADLAVDGGM